MNWLWRGARVLAVVSVLLVATLWYVIATQLGLSQLLAAGGSQLPGELAWRTASGSLAGPLQLRELDYRANGTLVQIDSLELDWQPMALARKQLQVKSLHLDGVQLRLPAASAAAPAGDASAIELADFELPLAFDVEQLLLTNLAIYPAGASEPVTIDRIAASASGQRDRIRLVNLAVDAPAGSASLAGEVAASGDWPLTLSLQWHADAPQLGRLRGSGEVSGHLKSAMNIVHRIDGAVQTQTRLKLTDALSAPRWSGDGDIAIADAGALAPALADMALDLNFQTAGSVAADGGDLNARLSNLNGTINQFDLRSTGELKVAREQLELAQFGLTAGQSTLAVDGVAGSHLDLNWTLDIPVLAELLPTASGQLGGSGELTGPPREALLRADLDVAQLSVAGLSLGALQGQASVDLSQRQASNLNLSAESISAAGTNWDTLSLRAQGVLARNNMQLALNGELAKVDLDLVGGWQQDGWLATATRLDIGQTVLGDWSLLDPARVVAGVDHASASDLCLASAPAQICLNANWAASEGAVLSSTVNRLPVERFAAWLPPELQSEQFFNAHMVASLASSGDVDARLNVQVPAAMIRYEADGKSIRREMGLSTVVANFAEQRLDLEAALGLGALGDAQLQAQIVDVDKNPIVEASLVGALRDLSLVSTFAPQLQTVRGVVDVDLRLAGAIDAPQPSGQVRMRELSAELPQLAVRISDGSLTVKPRADGVFLIDGQASSGAGQLALSGRADPAARQLQLNVSGDQFQVANARNMRAVISPDLDLTVDDNGTRVRGDVTVPTAYFKSGGSSGAVKVSGDVVIVDDGSESEALRSSSAVDLGLTVKLGDDVRVEAADFDGSITGTLSIEQRPGQVPVGSGTIEVVNGDYLIYGQKLIMERGRVLFGGGPLDDPELDLDVLRDVVAYEVKAGARVRGTAKTPILELYSEPEYSDADILSFIILGQPLGTKGGSYTLGKFITPDLYVSYGISLFGGDNTYNMRYKLNDRLTLQAVRSGENNSADLEYTLER